MCFKSNVAINNSLYNNIIIINKLYWVQDNIFSIINILLGVDILSKIIKTIMIITISVAKKLIFLTAVCDYLKADLSFIKGTVN